MPQAWTTLTRQIDRAVRTLNRDLKWLFDGRARDEAHYQRDLTPEEVRQEPELGIEVQRDIWRLPPPTSATPAWTIPAQRKISTQREIAKTNPPPRLRISPSGETPHSSEERSPL